MVNRRADIKVCPLVILCLNTDVVKFLLMHNYGAEVFMLHWSHFSSAHPQNFLSLDSVAGICNSSSHRGEEKALPQFWQGSGPVTSCMHTCSGSGRQVNPLRMDIWVTIYGDENLII